MTKKKVEERPYNVMWMILENQRAMWDEYCIRTLAREEIMHILK